MKTSSWPRWAWNRSRFLEIRTVPTANPTVLVAHSLLPLEFPRLFVFRNTIHFLATRGKFGDKLIATEGDEWIRRTVRVAAVPDMLPSLWTSVESPRASRLSE